MTSKTKPIQPDFFTTEAERRSDLPPVVEDLLPAKVTKVYATLWGFAADRHHILESRLRGEPWPWTQDPILQSYKFTNVFRVADRVSQYLIKNVIKDGDASIEDLFLRTMLFKIFNRIETWELLETRIGEISAKSFSRDQYNLVLSEAKNVGTSIYSPAYIMPSGGKNSQHRTKHSMHLALLEDMLKDKLPTRIAATKSMGKAFELISEYPTIGDFLAYQYVTDLNYAGVTTFSEMEFVVPGPGARDGMSKCFSSLGGLSEAEIIRLVTEKADAHSQLFGYTLPTLRGRPPQLIDIQNVFCEISKYARVRHPDIVGTNGRVRIKQKYSNPKELQQIVLPYWWESN